MRRLTRWVVALMLGFLGIGHMLFSIPNFQYAADCPGPVMSFTGCMVTWEGIFAVLAGVSLVACAVLVVRRRPLAGVVVGLVGTAALNLFFWLAAIPTQLSDVDFGIVSLPTPLTLAAAAAVLAARQRRVGGSPRDGLAEGAPVATTP